MTRTLKLANLRTITINGKLENGVNSLFISKYGNMYTVLKEIFNAVYVFPMGVKQTTMPNSGYFDVKRDIAIEKAGGFWCHACLVSYLAREQSPAPRYCQGCYVFLLKEARLLPDKKRPKWIPKPQKAREKQYQVSQVGDGIMSTLESKKIEVDIIHPSVATSTLPRRGPKHKKLPEDLIGQLSAEGMGSKAIASKLKREPGIDVSYKTIQRLLSGERKQLRPPITEHG